VIYEWRTYRANPGGTAEFLRLFGEVAVPIRAKHAGKLEAFWLPAEGDARTMHHLWSYASLDARAEVRKALAQDPAWMNDFARRVVPLIAEQHITFMSLIGGDLSAIGDGPHSRLVLRCVPFQATAVRARLGTEAGTAQFLHESQDPHSLTVLLGKESARADVLWQGRDGGDPAGGELVRQATLERLRPLEFSPLR
jgi:hypothetical protein